MSEMVTDRYRNSMASKAKKRCSSLRNKKRGAYFLGGLATSLDFLGFAGEYVYAKMDGEKTNDNRSDTLSAYTINNGMKYVRSIDKEISDKESTWSDEVKDVGVAKSGVAGIATGVAINVLTLGIPALAIATAEGIYNSGRLTKATLNNR